jgi:hypothetical protein
MGGRVKGKTMAKQTTTKPRARRKQGSLKELKMVLWQAVERSKEMIGSSDNEIARTGVYCLTQSAAQYISLEKVVNFEERIQLLEEKIDER